MCQARPTSRATLNQHHSTQSFSPLHSLLVILESTSTMSEYNNLFDFNAPQLGFDAVDSEYPALPPDLDQSAAWTAPLQSSVGMMEGDTAALLQLDVDSAPSMGVETIGWVFFLTPR